MTDGKLVVIVEIPVLDHAEADRIKMAVKVLAEQLHLLNVEVRTYDRVR